MTDKIEAIIASPPNREGLAVQLFVTDGGQLAEIYRDDGQLTMEIFTGPGTSINVDCSQILLAIKAAETNC